MRYDFAKREVLKMFDGMDHYYGKMSSEIRTAAKADYGDVEEYVREALEKAERTGGFRSVKRYIKNFIQGRIITRIHDRVLEIRKSYPRSTGKVRVTADLESALNDTHDPGTDIDMDELFPDIFFEDEEPASMKKRREEA